LTGVKRNEAGVLVFSIRNSYTVGMAANQAAKIQNREGRQSFDGWK
jgi:hypothetical protein